MTTAPLIATGIQLWLIPGCSTKKKLQNMNVKFNGSPDFMVYNVTNNTFTVMDFYLDYLLDLPGVK
ncbi:hypothetical protein, partial [Microcoleus sp. PH2017_29_MFU_D_A]|uniref:hypothetical protein n=1 Tax=Microcoleus sp. PH2017_29_MFU_D_A TaxID=2798839 RepID=UPI0025DC45CC